MDIFQITSVQITIACVLPFISTIIFSYGSDKNMYPWYGNLKRSKLCPPDWVFPLVWTFLFLSMGYASYRVWSNGNGFEGSAKIPLIIYLVHLFINVTWSQTFFTFHLIGAGLIHMIALWLSIISTAVAFATVDQQAAVLFMPYIAWVSLAVYLTYIIWILNPSTKKQKKK